MRKASSREILNSTMAVAETELKTAAVYLCCRIDYNLLLPSPLAHSNQCTEVQNFKMMNVLFLKINSSNLDTQLCVLHFSYSKVYWKLPSCQKSLHALVRNIKMAS